MSELFAGGVPKELEGRVAKILEREPEHGFPEELPRQRGEGREPFTLGRFLAPFRWHLGLAFLLVILGTVIQNIGPLIVAHAVDHGILAQDRDLLFQMCMAYLGAVVVSMALRYLSTVYTGRLGQRLMAGLRVLVFRHLQRLSVSFYTREKAGTVIAHMTSHIEALATLLQEGLVKILVQVVTLLVIIGGLFYMNPRLALVLFLVVVPAMAGGTRWFRRTAGAAHLTVRQRVGELIAEFRESLAGLRLITALNLQADRRERHRDLAHRHRAANDDTIRISSSYIAGNEVVGLVGQGVIVLVGYRMVLAGSLSVGELIAFVLFLRRFFSPIQLLMGLLNTWVAGQAAAVKLQQLLAEQPSVEEREDAVELAVPRGEVELRDVTFEYREGQPILTGIDLQVAGGETVALVGPTGAGKSTLASLLVRFYDPTSGRVSIDGMDLRDVTQESLRGQVALVPQEPFLFHGTIRENLLFAKPEATDEELAAACRAVGLDEILERLDRGLDSPCYEQGASLSSGQRQLLALARVFLARPEILILDEATSRLDLSTEAKIETALDELLAGRTAVLIAHRLATVRRANRIVLIDGGAIREIGSHEELLKKGGQYAAMIRGLAEHV